MRRLLALIAVAWPLGALAHHSPDHVAPRIDPALAAPQDAVHLWWVLAPLALVLALGLIRLLRRRRGRR